MTQFCFYMIKRCRRTFVCRVKARARCIHKGKTQLRGLYIQLSSLYRLLHELQSMIIDIII